MDSETGRLDTLLWLRQHRSSHKIEKMLANGKMKTVTSLKVYQIS